MMNKYNKYWSVGSFLFTLIGLIGIVAMFTCGTSSPKVEKTIEPKTNMIMVSGINIPENLEFAGEKVPLDYFDVKESLERELLINTYWHSQTILLIKRSARYFGDIEPILKKYNLPDDFKYLALAESGLANVTSPAHAVGFWQFLEPVAKEYGLEVNKEVDERYNTQKATEAACRLIIKSHDIYKSWTMAAASFNMGMKGLGEQVKLQKTDNYYDILLNEETARYIYRILALKLILNNPQDYGFSVKKEDYYQPIPYTELVVNKPVHNWAEFALSNGTNYKLLKLLNPWLRYNVLTNLTGKSYVVRIPATGFRDHAKELKREELDKIATQSEEAGK